MFRNRFRSQASAPPPPSAGAFVLCPLAWFPALAPEQVQWQQALYQWAFQEAQAVVQPSLPERDLLGVWN